MGAGHGPEIPAGDLADFRKNTPGRSTTARPPAGRKPVDAAQTPENPVVRGKVGVGSYEDPAEQARKARTKGKTGRPGR